MRIEQLGQIPAVTSSPTTTLHISSTAVTSALTLSMKSAASGFIPFWMARL